MELSLEQLAVGQKIVQTKKKQIRVRVVRYRQYRKYLMDTCKKTKQNSKLACASGRTLINLATPNHALCFLVFESGQSSHVFLSILYSNVINVSPVDILNKPPQVLKKTLHMTFF